MASGRLYLITDKMTAVFVFLPAHRREQRGRRMPLVCGGHAGQVAKFVWQFL